MRTGISITLKLADRRRLKVLARDRNAPHKHVWRAEIVLLSADGLGTNEIMRLLLGLRSFWRASDRGHTGSSVSGIPAAEGNRRLPVEISVRCTLALALHF